MPRHKFYPHEKVLHKYGLKQDDLPESIQNQVESWKNNKAKVGYHKEYEPESEQIAQAIEEYYANTTESEKMDFSADTAENVNETEIHALLDTALASQAPHEPDFEIGLSVPIPESVAPTVNETELQAERQDNPQYNGLDKICERLLNTSESNVFTLQQLKDEGIKVGFWHTDFTKLGGYNGTYFRINRIASSPFTYQILKK